YIGSMFTTIIIYGIGAQQVILGNLDVGTLIGASILSSRAIGIVNKALQLLDQLVKARHSLQILGALARQTLEKQTGVVPNSLDGVIELNGLSYQYSKQANPVYESLSLKINPGTITVFKGKNGMGKTTTAKIISGLIRPDKGTIAIDGVELHQYVPEWWRSQLIYLPQEPGFFQGSLLENLKVLNSEIEDTKVLELCNDIGLGEFLNSQEGGLHMMVDASSQSLPPGIRRRLALVRALVSDGKIVILDDPLEGVDPQGSQAIMILLIS
ncbi:ATP-binding cassette domain-containing protein, partial [bacterium]|nr:ATP-binding cassette domain-containing protein [bacterium]